MRAAAALLAAMAAWAQTEQPTVANSRFQTLAFSGDLASQLRSSEPAWFGYAIKTGQGDQNICCWNGDRHGECPLEDGRHGATSLNVRKEDSHATVKLEGMDSTAVLFRVTRDGVGKVEAYSLSCPLDSGGLPFAWITGVPAQQSLELLKILSSSSAKYVADGAVFAISQHAGTEAVDLLIQEANNNPIPHIREQALFWLAQRAGDRAASAIVGAIEHDPDTKVKESAVFALSQLPRDEGVPKLIEVAKGQRNRQVCRQAFFWLGQSRDPRALAYIEQVLTR